MAFPERTLFVISALALMLAGAQAQQEADSGLKVIHGPAEATLEKVAQIQLPAGYLFLDGAGTRALMKKSGEPVSGNEMGLIVPTNANWSVVFEFNDVGYVKDDDKDKLDPRQAACFHQGRHGRGEQAARTPRHSADRNRRLGAEARIQPAKRTILRAIRATSGGEPLLNYNTRILGRKGVMEVVLVCDPDQLATTLPKFKDLLSKYSFQTGQSYAEYHSGDRSPNTDSRR